MRVSMANQTRRKEGEGAEGEGAEGAGVKVNKLPGRIYGSVAALGGNDISMFT